MINFNLSVPASLVSCFSNLKVNSPRGSSLSASASGSNCCSASLSISKYQSKITTSAFFKITL